MELVDMFKKVSSSRLAPVTVNFLYGERRLDTSCRRWRRRESLEMMEAVELADVSHKSKLVASVLTRHYFILRASRHCPLKTG